MTNGRLLTVHFYFHRTVSMLRIVQQIPINFDILLANNQFSTKMTKETSLSGVYE